VRRTIDGWVGELAGTLRAGSLWRAAYGWSDDSVVIDIMVIMWICAGLDATLLDDAKPGYALRLGRI
jgi:hypothetical protein